MSKVNMNYIHRVLSIILLSVLLGCGFHLRGSVNWPAQYQTVYLSSFAASQKSDRSSLMGSLGRQLPSTITIVDVPEKADLIIQVLSENIQVRTLAASAYGQNKEETHHYIASVQVTNKNAQVILPPTTITAQKDFSYNEGDLLSKSSGEQTLRKELVYDSSLMLMRRITAALNKLEK